MTSLQQLPPTLLVASGWFMSNWTQISQRNYKSGQEITSFIYFTFVSKSKIRLNFPCRLWYTTEYKTMIDSHICPKLHTNIQYTTERRTQSKFPLLDTTKMSSNINNWTKDFNKTRFQSTAVLEINAFFYCKFFFTANR